MILSTAPSIRPYLSIRLFIVLYRIFYSLSLSLYVLFGSCLCSSSSSSFDVSIYLPLYCVGGSCSCSYSSSPFDCIYRSISLLCCTGSFPLSLCVVSILFLFVFFSVQSYLSVRLLIVLYRIYSYLFRCRSDRVSLLVLLPTTST